MERLTDKVKSELVDQGAIIYSDQWFKLDNIEYYMDDKYPEYDGWDFKTKAGFYNQSHKHYNLVQAMDKAPDMVAFYENTKEA